MTGQSFRIRSWIKADAEQARDGLVGFLSLFVGDLIIDNVVLRRTLDRRYTLSWPARTDKHGKKHPSVRPLDDTVRRRIEAQIFAELAGHVGVDLAQEVRDG